MDIIKYARKNVKFLMSSPISGNFDESRYPFITKPLQAHDDIRAKSVVLYKPAQSIGTVSLQIGTAYQLDIFRKTVLAVAEPDGVWICHDESMNTDHAEMLVKALVEELDLPGIFVCSWAYVCSKPRIDEFGGGAFAVQRGRDTIWIDAAASALRLASISETNDQVEPVSSHAWFDIMKTPKTDKHAKNWYGMSFRETSWARLSRELESENSMLRSSLETVRFMASEQPDIRKIADDALSNVKLTHPEREE